jgi:hypothetical protein
MDEISSESGQSIKLPLGIPKFKCNIPAICPPSLLKRRLQRRDASMRLRVTLDVRQEYAYSPHPAGLLRSHRNRPRSRTAEKHDELASSHVRLLRTRRSQCLKLSTLEPSGERELAHNGLRR